MSFKPSQTEQIFTITGFVKVDIIKCINILSPEIHFKGDSGCAKGS